MDGCLPIHYFVFQVVLLRNHTFQNPYSGNHGIITLRITLQVTKNNQIRLSKIQSYVMHTLMNHTVSFRNALPEDAVFISRGFHTAMLYEDTPESQILTFAEKICRREDTLYSWRNTILAVVDGNPVGMITSYEGSRYHEMRVLTLQLVKEHLGIEFPDMEDEASVGEYYLDSLAVLSSLRGMGIGRSLLQQGILRGQSLGLPVTLAVDPVNVRAQKLYRSLGFEPHGELFIFGHTYWKWIFRQ